MRSNERYVAIDRVRVLFEKGKDEYQERYLPVDRILHKSVEVTEVVL